MVYLQIWGVGLVEKAIGSTRVKFAIVGGVGFGINALVLAILYKEVKIPLLPAQILAAEAAILMNFNLHHRWTYSGYKDLSLINRLGRFHASAWAGSLITLLALIISVNFLRINYLLALCCGGLAGMAWNYSLNHFVVWSKTAGSYS